MIEAVENGDIDIRKEIVPIQYTDIHETSTKPQKRLKSDNI